MEMDQDAFRAKLTERGRQIASTHTARTLTEFLQVIATPEGASLVNATGDDLEAIREGLAQALRDREREELRVVYETLEQAVVANDAELLATANQQFMATTVANLNRVVAHLERIAGDQPEGEIPILQTLSTFALTKNDTAALEKASAVYDAVSEETRRAVFDVWILLDAD